MVFDNFSMSKIVYVFKNSRNKLKLEKKSFLHIFITFIPINSSYLLILRFK